MALLDDLMAEGGIPALMQGHGDSAIYTPAGGAPVSLTAIVGAEATEEDDTFDGRRQRRVREVTITRDPTSPFGGVAAPSRTATVTIGGVEYAIESIDGESSELATLKLVRRSQIEVTRERYRQR